MANLTDARAQDKDRRTGYQDAMRQADLSDHYEFFRAASGAPASDAVVRIRRGLAPTQAEPAAALYWRAFGHQILPLPVSAARGQALLLRCLHPYRALTADVDGVLIGLIGLRDGTGGLFGPTPAQIQAIWPARTGRLLNAAAQLHRAGPASEELLVDGIVVAPEWRGRDVGGSLIRAAMAEAAARDFPGLRAEVAPGNRAGLALYQSLGFTQIGRARIGWPWSGLLAGKTRIMRLALRPPRGCPPSP